METYVYSSLRIRVGNDLFRGAAAAVLQGGG